MAKKSIKGQINFYRAMLIIGVIITIMVVKGLLNAAPALSINTVHEGPPPAKECLECHVKEVENVPIMPHRPMSSCVFCHEPKMVTKK